ncbi:phage tail length tape measure family protein [Methylobacterium segetis]|uniref:phage tail length tape measure family protein n=1 Tax=Methylobacterium segetis TaxID=2488750 RepID=UPI00104D3D09|nr:phage tail length tape measure family protein [Methylobacterium segetis]
MPSAAGGASPSSPASLPPSSPATMREVERLRSQLDEEYRRQKSLNRAEDILGRGYGSGLVDAAERDRLRGLALQRFAGTNDNAPRSRGLDAFQKRDLMYQGGDVVASLGSGAGLGTVAFQQGPQILQGLAAGEGGLRGGLTALGQSAAALVTPFTVAATSATALGAAFLYAGSQAAKDQEILERATQGIGRSTGATAGQLDALAKASAEAGKVSTSTSREIVAGFASTGQIALPVIGDLTRVTSEYARLLSTDVPTATAELARMFADPARGADELAARIGGLDDRTRQLIQTQIEQGDRSAAQQTLAESLKATIDANASATSRWGAAWDIATAAADRYWEAAKKVAGVKLGLAPEGAQEAAERLNKQVDDINARRKRFGMDPLSLGDSRIVQRDTANLIKETQEAEARAKALEELANKASTTAGNIARSIDPNFARLSELRKQQSDLSAALADPLARNKLADFGQTETAYLGVTRAIESLTDANGKLISSEEMARRQDQLRLDAINAKTEAEKRSVAERQKAFDLIGKTVTGSDARSQIERAGFLARAEAASKGSDKEERDDFDRATRSTEDRIRRLREQGETYGMGAEAVERFRVQQELLTAAQRAGRDVTPELTARIEEYANQAAEAAKRNEALREAMRTQDLYRSAGSDSIRTFISDLGNGKSITDAWANSVDRLRQRFLDMASDNITDLIFGKRGSSDGGLLGSLFKPGDSGGASSPGLSDFFKSDFFPSFDGGGFTGAGGRYDPAGIVHRGEVVFSQDDVRRLGGVGIVEGMRRGGRGYADGGVVGREAFTMPRAMSPAPGSTAGGLAEVHIHNAPAGTTAKTTQGPRGPRLDIQIDQMVAGALMGGPSTQYALKKLSGGNRLRG